MFLGGLGGGGGLFRCPVVLFCAMLFCECGQCSGGIRIYSQEMKLNVDFEIKYSDRVSLEKRSNNDSVLERVIAN